MLRTLSFLRYIIDYSELKLEDILKDMREEKKHAGRSQPATLSWNIKKDNERQASESKRDDKTL